MSSEITIVEDVSDIAITEIVNTINVNETNLTIDITEQIEETSIVLSVGAPGPQGPIGPTGPTGPTGPAGAVNSVTAGNSTITIGGASANPTVKVTDYTVIALTASSADYANLAGGSFTSGLIGTVGDSQLTSGVSSTGLANKILKIASDGTIDADINAGSATSVTNKIQFRSDYYSTWGMNNPLLALGEIGYDRTQGLFKIGDGSTLWNSLPYTSDTSLLQGTITPSDDTVTSAKIVNDTIVNADINTSAAIDATKISGTAVTQADTKTVTSAMLVAPPIGYEPTTGMDIFDRTNAGLASTSVATNQLGFTTFIATKSFTVSKLITHVINTPAYNTGTVQFALFSYNGLDTLTPKATSSVFNSTTPLTALALNQVTLTALSGADLNIVAGQMYAVGRMLGGSWTTQPSLASFGSTIAITGGLSNGIKLYPIVAGTVTSGISVPLTTTTPLTIANGVLNGAWFRLLP